MEKLYYGSATQVLEEAQGYGSAGPAYLDLEGLQERGRKSAFSSVPQLSLTHVGGDKSKRITVRYVTGG